MARLSRVALVSLLAYMLPSTWADIAPASGKYVPYKVEVTSMPESTGMKLAIFPWSISSGRPEAHVQFVEPHTPVQIGRRVASVQIGPHLTLRSPKFWAVRADAKAELDGLRGETQGGKWFSDSDRAEAIGHWLSEGRNAVKCTGAEIAPQFLAESGEEEFLDKFAVISMNADQDKLECVMRKSDDVDAEVKDNLGSYAEPEAGSSNGSISWGSWGFSIVALGAICGLVWRLSSALRKTSGQNVSVQE